MDTISVQNKRGQVTHFSISGPADPRAVILQQRIARGELERVTTTAKSKRTRASAVSTARAVDAGVRDEAGNYLASVHGGGLDPDAAGDALGVPTGSGLSAEQAARDAAVAGMAAAQQVVNARGVGADVSVTTEVAVIDAAAKLDAAGVSYEDEDGVDVDDLEPIDPAPDGGSEPLTTGDSAEPAREKKAPAKRAKPAPEKKTRAKAGEKS